MLTQSMTIMTSLMTLSGGDNVNMAPVPRYGHQSTDLVISTPYSNFGQINKNQHKRVRTVRPVLVNPKG